ncbi:MAG: aminotransferase class IV [Parcubacteria group bacterium]|jgi:D-amino acid aminotransferase
MKKKYCYFNGKIVEEKNAHISPFDLGILRGYGVFDVMCTTNGKPFHLSDHWNRLLKSAARLRLTVPISETEYANIITKLLARTPYTNTSIRTVLTGGISANGMTLHDTPTFYILLHDMDQFIPDQKLYDSGAKIITHNFIRAHAQSKTTNYIEAIIHQEKRVKKDAVEILYAINGNVSECSTSNIFMVKNDILYTPKKDILLGITRKIILTIAQKEKIATKEKDITLDELYDADEVFLTGSAKHILPIVKIDTKKIGTGKPGTITQRLSQKYFDYLSRY